MMLPYCLDLIPEKLGILYAKLFSWHPEGKKVLLMIDESGDDSFTGTIVSGMIVRIENIGRVVIKAGKKTPCALIQLNSVLNYQGSEISWVIAEPRFSGHSFYRLPITWNVVQIYRIENPELSHSLRWEDIFAICSMKLAKNQVRL